MQRLGAAAFLIAGFVFSGFIIFMILVFAGAAAGNSGQTSLFMGKVLPISIGVSALWLITSLVLFWRGRDGWAVSLAWGPGVLVFLVVILSN